MSADIGREVEELRAKAQSCLPQIDGELRAPGLEDQVSIVRDAHGVPHIRASSLHDLWFAQGFVHAQDRLWQMEAGRHQASGRLAEILDESALESDRLVRRIGLLRAAEREWAQANVAYRAVIEPYVAGVNAFLASGEPLPIEFEVLSSRPRAWTPVDVVVPAKWWGRYFQSVPFGAKLENLALLRALGTEYFARLFPGYPPDAPVIVPPGEEAGSLEWEIRDLLEGTQRGDDDPGGSNNWAVDGTLSTTGKPLLAHDGHLRATVPTSSYICHLVCPEFAAVGASSPGLPGVALTGHNGRVAWSLTRSVADLQDLFIERLDGGDLPRYLFRDEWLPVQVHREEIRVRGRGEPVVELVYETHHGPIVSGGPGEPGEALALAWGGMEPTQSFASLVPIHGARTVQEAIEAHRERSNSNNRVFADTSGNIGYLLSGHLPKRPGGPAHFPVPGWTGEHEWEGWVPFEEMPRSVNPPSHFINTSNNLIVRPDYPHYVSAGPFPSARAQRVASLLPSRAPHTVETFAAMQGDVYTAGGHRLARRAARVEPATERGRHARDLLAAWDGVLGAESAAAAAYEVLRDKLLDATVSGLRDALPEPRPSEDLLRQRFWAQLIYAVGNDDPLFLELLPYDSWDEPLALALDRAAAYMDEELGPSGWAWGKLHSLIFQHALGRSEREAALFNVGRYLVGGDGLTVFNTGYFAGPDFQARIFPNDRLIIDLDDVRRSLFILPTGQSGHVASPHYGDLKDDFLNLRYRPLLWDEQDIEENAEGHLTLTP